MLTQDNHSMYRVKRGKRTGPSLPLFFDKRAVLKLKCSLLVRDNDTKAPLLAFTHNSGKRTLRSAYMPSYEALDFTADAARDLGIDPYDVCILLGMAQALAQASPQEDSTQIFRV